jgi:hypothetical protein
MLTNPVIKELSVDDLNQRYDKSYIQYAGEVLYVYDFWKDNGRIICSALNGDNHKFKIDNLNWQLLNTERPKAGWYQGTDTLHRPWCVYFRLETKKQFHRGLSEGNHRLFLPHPKLQGRVNRFDLFSQTFNGPEQVKRRMTLAEIASTVKARRSVILQPNLCVALSEELPGELWFFYRSTVIAAHTEGKGTEIYSPQFEDELRESVLDLQIEPKKKVLRSGTMEYNPEQKPFKPAFQWKYVKEDLIKIHENAARELEIEFENADMEIAEREPEE